MHLPPSDRDGVMQPPALLAELEDANADAPDLTEAEHAAWVTRTEALRLAGISKTTLKRRTRDGTLRPRQSREGWLLYQVDELVALRRTHVLDAHGEDPGALMAEACAEERAARGARAAEVFARFEQGQSAAEVVIALRMDPDEVTRWRDQWAKSTGRGLWLSEAALARLLRASLVLAPSPELPGTAPLDQIDREEALVRAIARAHDAAKKAYQAPAATVAELAAWLAVRWTPGETGTLTLCASALGFHGPAHLERYTLAEWTSAEALVQAVWDRVSQAQRVNERQLEQLGTLHDGTYELALSTAQGTQRTWWSQPSPVLRELLQALKHSGQTRTMQRLRELLDREQDAQKDRTTKRRQALAAKARERAEEMQEDARDRARQRTARARSQQAEDDALAGAQPRARKTRTQRRAPSAT